MDLSLKRLNYDPNELDQYMFRLKLQHVEFAEEAFIYLFNFFRIRTQNGLTFSYLSEAIGYAIVTVGYIFRRRIRTLFQTSQINPNDICEFVKFAEYFESAKTPCYFFRILRRISHIFELTLYCLKEGYDYTETARQIVVDNVDISFFDNNGGWSRLHETASFIAEVGEILRPVIRMENPQDVCLKSFVKTVKLLEVSSTAPLQMKTLVLLKKDVLHNISDIHTLDFRVAKVFYDTICQHSSRAFVMNSKLVDNHWNYFTKFKLDIQSEKGSIVRSFQKQIAIILGETECLYLTNSVAMKLAGYFANFRHLSDLISTEYDLAEKNHETMTQSKLSLAEKSCVSLNEYFILHPEYVRQMKYLDMKSSEERTIVSDVRKILVESIDQNNYFLLGDGRFVVYRTDCKFDCNTTAISTIPD